MVETAVLGHLPHYSSSPNKSVNPKREDAPHAKLKAMPNLPGNLGGFLVNCLLPVKPLAKKSKVLCEGGYALEMFSIY